MAYSIIEKENSNRWCIYEDGVEREDLGAFRTEEDAQYWIDQRGEE